MKLYSLLKVNNRTQNIGQNKGKQTSRYLIFVFLFVIILAGCSNKSQNTSSVNVKADQQDTAKNETKILGVFKEMNKDNNSILVFDVENNVEVLLSFHGGTDVKDQYDQIITVAQIAVGEMVDITYNQENSKIVSMQISKQAWEYKQVGNLKINTTDKILKIGERKYQYSDRLLIASENKFVSLIDLNEKDELTVKGVGSKIYSIIVTKGHGYIKLTGCDAFIDGNISVGYDIFLTISEDMLIAAREGSYKITMEKGDLTGTKMVNVIRNQEVTVDMSEYKKEAERLGSVTFNIKPKGADLFIDDTLTDYSKAVELKYGEYQVQVKLTGYSTYTGVLTIAQSSQSIRINLADPEDSNVEESTDTNINVTAEPSVTTAPSATTIPSATVTPSVTATPSATTSSEAVDTKTTKDTSHKIFVEAPEGATVYINGIKKGTVPVNFTKEIGTFTITLSKSGYETKSYTITIADDAKDAKLTFPSMTVLK